MARTVKRAKRIVAYLPRRAADELVALARQLKVSRSTVARAGLLAWLAAQRKVAQ